MKTVVRIICIAAICALFGIDRAAAQLPATGCTSEPSANATQTLRCRGGLVIVAEEGNRTFWLVYADGKYFDNPINLEHGQLNDNPSNDTMFTRALPDLLDQIREQGARKNQ